MIAVNNFLIEKDNDKLFTTMKQSITLLVVKIIQVSLTASETYVIFDFAAQ